jgi:hypothetical protein
MNDKTTGDECESAEFDAAVKNLYDAAMRTGWNYMLLASKDMGEKENTIQSRVLANVSMESNPKLYMTVALLAQRELIAKEGIVK